MNRNGTESKLIEQMAALQEHERQLGDAAEQCRRSRWFVAEEGLREARRAVTAAIGKVERELALLKDQQEMRF